jgi:protein TonB
MFNNLIESDAHTADIKRRGSFVIATTLVYALFIMAAGVGSIYAYEAHVDNQSLELTALVTMVPLSAAPPKSLPERSVNRQPRAAAATNNTSARVPMRTALESDVTDMRRIPDKLSATGSNLPPAPPNAVLGNRNYDIGGDPNSSLLGSGSRTNGNRTGTDGNAVEITRDVPPEMPEVKTKTTKTRPVQSLGVIESKVIRKGIPPYPELAKKARASGIVTVQILLDEQGRVVSARATDGHPLLRGAAEQAAYQTKFSPTLLSNQPVKVSGVITFNFVLR